MIKSTCLPLIKILLCLFKKMMKTGLILYEQNFFGKPLEKASWILKELLFFIGMIYLLFVFVAITDLFPFTNQCPCQAIWPLTDQSEAECIDSFFPSRTIFSSPFWKSRQVREHLVSSQGRPLSCPLLRTFHMDQLHWRHAATSYSHRRTSLAISHMSCSL